MRFNRFVLGAAIASSPVSATTAQSVSPLARRIDSIASANLAADHAIGAVVAVVKGNDTLFYRGYGKANVEWDVPMATDAVFEIGSMTKQFTAVSILKLRDEGKLSLDDDITKWLPDFNTHGNKLPLRRLLDHTSGITDATELPDFRNSVTNMAFPPDSIYALVNRQPFKSAPGATYSYNNTGYWLLSLVIQKASGMSYPRYLDSKLFQPLGMKQSMACSIPAMVPHRASGYQVRNGMMRRALLNVPTWYMGSGVLCSSAADMLTWIKALHGGKVLPAASYAELIKPSALNDGKPIPYAMGLDVEKDSHGNAYIGHSGEVVGFASRANWYPAANLSVVVLMNNSGDASPSDMAEAIAAVVLANDKR